MATTTKEHVSALSAERRAEIAAFLRARRARLRPEDVGLPDGSRRRTPGLRREEVAQLAGVSTEWYKWLEQARDVRASEDTLRRIARALRLEPGETLHLLTLSGYVRDGVAADDDDGDAHSETVTPILQRLLDELDPAPAWVLGARWDILAWNRGATVIFGDLDAMPPIERNALHQSFVATRLRTMLVEWEKHARDLVARVRLAHARHVDDPWFNEIVSLVRSRSREFREWWDERLVMLPRDGTKRYEHPELGTLTFDYTVLDVASDRFALQLAVYLPAPGTSTRERLERLLPG